MTVAVSCNLSDGVILGVDSAITMNNPQGQVVKVYENAVKLFQLGTKPLGIAIFGMGNILNRGIGSYIREFELQDPDHVVSREAKIEDIIEELRLFFCRIYQSTIVPELEAQQQKKFNEIPKNELPILGLVVGGFSAKSYLSQVWEVLIPLNDSPRSAKLCRKEGDFGSNWFALNEPIFRYHKGYDRTLLEDMKNYFEKLRGIPLTNKEKEEIGALIGRHEYLIPFQGMPIKEGIAYVKFLVEMVINHHRFSIGAPIVGGNPQIGLVTYKGEKFEILEGG